MVGAIGVGGCSATTTSSPSPTTPASVNLSSSPAASPDPSRFATAISAPRVSIGSTTNDKGVSVVDLTFGDDDIGQTDAYLVVPVGAKKAASVIWFHWLESGAPTSNRTEFLDEAKAMAHRGVVSLLVDGTLPWKEPPTSIAHDVAAVEREVKMLRRGVDLLTARPEVDPDHIAAVGHDFGSMYCSLLFGADERVKALAMMTPTARWADWFYRYWRIRDPEADYLSAMAPLDPVTWLPRANGRAILLQFSASDRFVPTDVAREITDAAGASAEDRTYDDGHELGDEARTERDTWLAKELGLGS
jgi:predicted esterase